MAKKVPRLHGRSKHKKADRLTQAERRARLAERQQQWTQQWIALAKAFIPRLLNGEVPERLGRPAHQWGDRREAIEVHACCNTCRRQQRGWFRRQGTSPRRLVMEGLVIDFRVPRVRCACGGTVDVSCSVFVP
ncbi:MAG: hypothetical protein HY332_08480 [Chloroflexi bacterium]|nr:hypothetical protein [Chloroflexota bacterium]